MIEQLMLKRYKRGAQRDLKGRSQKRSKTMILQGRPQVSQKGANMVKASQRGAQTEPK